MKSEMHEFCRRATVSCGFADSEGEIHNNATMTELLALNKDAFEIANLLEKIRTEKSLFYVISNLAFDYKTPRKLWQIHFIPLLSQENGYLGTFFHAHEFLVLSPLDYVDGIQPYAVSTEKPNKLFTDKEWQVLFFTMHRFSSKEIARRLDVFPSTVESHLKTIYGKVNVHSACQLRIFGKSKGFERYIPAEFIHKGRGFVEMGGIA
ncbi:helix-turn-helix transcriptional regulator [Arsenophonus endosymbiont of Aleurodicus floccissimus]|uniref:helix-turn-helix transcriptional regulator n=1 Tax=Arsenophonus endosymbiont of Aleurodicus floccissimus TaxID=2152761 RepID=UPI001601FDB2|nr:helix-turn-helix transcriptional regulator [Arsenophonus endosymbiont of Aleurodicus floccissimus]